MSRSTISTFQLFETFPDQAREEQRIREYQCGPYHDWHEFIDPRSGGFVRCSRCGAEMDCEDPDGDLG